MVLVVFAINAVSEKWFKVSKRSKTMMKSIRPKLFDGLTKIKILIYKIDVYMAVNVFIAIKDQEKSNLVFDKVCNIRIDDVLGSE